MDLVSKQLFQTQRAMFVFCATDIAVRFATERHVTASLDATLPADSAKLRVVVSTVIRCRVMCSRILLQHPLKLQSVVASE